jgi:hypothetical protein
MSLNLQDSEVKNAAAAVVKISINGNLKTRACYFDNELRNASSCKSLQCLHTELQKVVGRLQATGVFSAADVSIDMLGQKDGAIETGISVTVKEKSNPFLQMSVNSGRIGSSSATSADIGAEIEGIIPNVLGFSESYRCSMRTNDRNEKEIFSTVSFPSLSSKLIPFQMTARRHVEDKSSINSLKTEFSTALLSVSSPDQSHKLSTEISFRDETVQNGKVPLESSVSLTFPGQVKDSSPSVLLTAVPSTKVSAIYSFLHDTRNHSGNATTGELLDCVLEVFILSIILKYSCIIIFFRLLYRWARQNLLSLH